jgi:uncharacterized protein YjbJ (UPF0337 family)
MTTDQPEGAGASSVPDDPEQLKQDIERTREQLGQTVEALVAKADVKAQAQEAKAQAKEKVGQLTDRLKGTTTQARDQATAQATAVGGKVRDVTPEPVQRAARHAAARTSPRQATIAAAAVGVALVAFILIRRRRGR